MSEPVVCPVVEGKREVLQLVVVAIAYQVGDLLREAFSGEGLAPCKHTAHDAEADDDEANDGEGGQPSVATAFV